MSISFAANGNGLGIAAFGVEKLVRTTEKATVVEGTQLAAKNLRSVTGNFLAAYG